VRHRVAILAALGVAAVTLLAIELAQGGASYGNLDLEDPCAERTVLPGEGFDATMQRIVLDGLDGAACELGTTREELVIAFDPDFGAVVEWDRETIEDAVRSGLLESIDDAWARDGIGDIEATILRQVVENAPIGWLVEGGAFLADLFDRR
jgi:hypothetical protein